MALIASGGLGREVHPLLRAAVLPGSEWVLPLLAREWPVKAGDAVRSVGGQARHRGRSRHRRVRPRLRLARRGGRQRGLHPHDAQRDRPRRPAGLGPRPPLPRRPDADAVHLGIDDDPVIPVEHGRNAHRIVEHSRYVGDRGLRPLADARRSGPDRPRADRIHGGDRAVRVVAGDGARAPAARARARPRGDRRRRRLRRSDVASNSARGEQSTRRGRGDQRRDLRHRRRDGGDGPAVRPGPALQARALPGARPARRPRRAGHQAARLGRAARHLPGGHAADRRLRDVLGHLPAHRPGPRPRAARQPRPLLHPRRALRRAARRGDRPRPAQAADPDLLSRSRPAGTRRSAP